MLTSKDHLFPQFKDLVTRYSPSVIFSDGEWDLPSEKWRAPELLAWLFNDSAVAQHVVVNDRWGRETRHKHGGYYTTEYGAGLPGASSRLGRESRARPFLRLQSQRRPGRLRERDRGCC